jgi:hypothetical protein
MEQTAKNITELDLTPHGRIERYANKLGIDLYKEPPIKAAIIMAALTWLPLVILTLINGTAIGDSITVPFFKDFPPNVRFLIQSIISPRIRIGAVQFVTRGIITDKHLHEYEQLIKKILRWRDSSYSEVVILLVAYIMAYLTLRAGIPAEASTWYLTIDGGERTVTVAGYWYLFISTPIYQFFLYRWIYRYFLWCYFLRKVSKMPLNLISTHPDGMGGLGFLPFTQRVFGVFIFTLSLMFASTYAVRIVYEGMSFLDSKFIFIGMLLFLLILFLFPLGFFAGKLINAKRSGLLKYGSLATDYNRDFDKKWIEKVNPENEPMLGTGDIQSLADLGNSFRFIQEMKMLPIDKDTIVALLISGIIPMIPLLLYEVPVKDIFDAVKGLVM